MQPAQTQVIICDKAVEERYAKPIQQCFLDAGMTCYLLSFPGGETHKTREQKQALENEMFMLNCHRDTCIIAIGGGVTTDLAGFVAATFCRGLPLVYMPTTLLSMVDASIGGKTGVNTRFGKNLIGSFYQPNAVFIDPMSLRTLSKKQLRIGMAEVIKHALLVDPDFLETVAQSSEKVFSVDLAFLSNMIAKNAEIKAAIIEKDEYDHGMRQLLNIGHSIGHALESVSDYSLSHGDAVSLGLVAEAHIAELLGIADAGYRKKLITLLKKYKLPTRLLTPYNHDEIIKALQHDKKKSRRRFMYGPVIGVWSAV